MTRCAGLFCRKNWQQNSGSKSPVEKGFQISSDRHKDRARTTALVRAGLAKAQRQTDHCDSNENQIARGTKRPSWASALIHLASAVFFGWLTGKVGIALGYSDDWTGVLSGAGGYLGVRLADYSTLILDARAKRMADLTNNEQETRP